MRFHTKCHGKNITISEDATVATRAISFNHGIVFGDQPLAPLQEVTVELNTVTHGICSGALRYGFTNHNPDNVNPDTLPQYAIPNLSKQPGNWAKAFPEDKAESGTKLTFCYTDQNTVVTFINNKQLETYEIGASVDITQPIWPLLDVYGCTGCIRLMTESTKLTRKSDVCDAASSSRPDQPLASTIRNWTETDVQDWLKINKLQELCEVLDCHDGKHLVKMYSQYCEDPKEFKDDMKADYQMNSRNYLKFSVALEELFKK